MNQHLNKAIDALKEARELVQHWGEYADSYFQEKWDLAGDLEKLDKMIEELEALVDG